MTRHRNFGEARDLIKEAERIPLDQIIEPTHEPKEGQHIIGTVEHADIKRLYTLMQRFAQEIENFRAVVIYRGGIDQMTPQEIARIQRTVFKHEAVREMFFLTIFLRFQHSEAEGVGIAKGWQVFYQEETRDK